MSRSSAPVRFYPSEYPAEGDKVWVKVLNVNDTSAIVQLLEYANHEGMIPYTEFTRLRIRSVGKIIKAGRMEAVQVLRVDREKRYIDLSKKQVTQTEVRKCEERYLKARDVQSIICHAADDVKMSRSEAMELVAYPLYQKYGSAWETLKLAMKMSMAEPKVDILAQEGIDIPENLKEAILITAQHRLREQPVKLRVDLDITCFTADGVNAIRDVLRIGQQYGDDQLIAIPLTASIVAPPAYTLRAQTEHREEGLKRLSNAVAAMQAAMTERGGIVRIAEAPHVVGEDEKKEEKEESHSSSSSSSDEEEDEEDA